MKKLVLFIAMLFVFGCAYGRYISQGDEAFQKGDYDRALASYEAAQREDPESKEAAQKILKTKEKLVEEHTSEIAAALNAGNHLAAIDAGNRAYVKLPDNPTILANVGAISSATFAKADELVRKQDFSNAVMLIDAVAAKLPPETASAELKSTATKKLWATELTTRAEAAAKAKRRGDAMLLYAKAGALSDDTTLSNKATSFRLELMKDYQYNVVPKPKDKKEGTKITTNLLLNAGQGTSLRVHAPGTKLKTIHAEPRYKVGAPSFKTESSGRKETVRYQSGTKQVPNPFYEQKQNKVMDEERRLVDYEEDLSKYQDDVAKDTERVAKEGDTPGTSTGAEQSLSRAKSNVESARRKVDDQRRQVLRAKEDLAKESPTKEEPVYSDHTFTITTKTLKGRVDLRGEVAYPSSERKNTTFRKNVLTQATDDTHPAQSIAGVKEDPLSLPSKGEMTRTMNLGAHKYIEGVVFKGFSDWRKEMLAVAKAEADIDKRIDMYTIYIMTDPKNVDPTIPAEIAANRGVPDSVRILSFGQK